MDIITFATSLAGLLLGGGGVGAFMHYKHESRAKELDNEKSEIENDDSLITQWKDLYREAEAKSQAKSKRIEELYQRLTRKSEQLAKVTVQREKLLTFKCLRVACTERQPPIALNDLSVDTEKIVQ